MVGGEGNKVGSEALPQTTGLAVAVLTAVPVAVVWITGPVAWDGQRGRWRWCG